MNSWSDEATQQFLVRVSDDLARQFGFARVAYVRVEPSDAGVVLRAELRTRDHRLELVGRGQNLVHAYSAMLQHAPEAALTGSFVALVEGRSVGRSP